MTTLITPLPTPPTRQDSSNFNDRADDFLGALPLFQQEANNLATEVQASVAEVEIARQAVVSTANITKWISGTTYAQGTSVWSPVNGRAYRKMTTSAGGGTDPSLDSVNYKSVAILRETLSVKDFGASGDGVTDDTLSIKSAVADAFIKKQTVFLPQGNYVVSDEIRLDDGSGGFVGVAIEGENIEATKILFKPSSPTAKCFSLNGGSGTHTNKYIKNLTIQPFDINYNGLGTGIFIDGQCFALVQDVVVSGLNYGIQITNTHTGSFSEFNTFENIRLVENAKGIAFERNGGLESFHGNRFHDVQINIPNGGYGIYSKGISAINYVYNCYFRINLFGGSGTRYGIYTENTNTDYLSGDITGEGSMTLKATASGEWKSWGNFTSISTISFDVTSNKQFRFANLRNGSNFSNVGISSYSPAPFRSDYADRDANGEFPGAFKVSGTGIESLGFATYQAGGNAFFFGDVPFGGTMESFRPGWRVLADGSAIQSYGTTSQLRDSTNTTNQLLLSDGRTGGNIGRALSYAVTANTGVAQSITTISNTNSDNASLIYVRISGTNFEHRYLLAMNRNGFGAASYVNTLTTFWTLNTSGVTFTSFNANANGQLIVNLTTDRNLTIQCREIGLGYQFTS